MKEGYEKLNLDIKKEIKEKLEEIASKKEMSLSGLVRLILKEYLDNENG